MGETLNLKEELAALCHDQWSGWMRYLFSKATPLPDGGVYLPSWAVERWQRQMETDYLDLTEQERESDRTEADRFLALAVSTAPSR